MNRKRRWGDLAALSSQIESLLMHFGVRCDTTLRAFSPR